MKVSLNYSVGNVFFFQTFLYQFFRFLIQLVGTVDIQYGICSYMLVLVDQSFDGSNIV